MYYRNIIVIGNGSLLINCLKHLHTYSPGSLKCIEPEINNFSNLKTICELKNIEYLSLTNKKELADFFSNITERTLVLSIHNSYIFIDKVFENKNLKIINFHNSLLPKHPGRNAPTWSIYEEDETAGITWHEIIREVDKGDIILQKSILLNDEITGMQLTKSCVDVGFTAFKEILPFLLSNEYATEKQLPSKQFKMHYSYQIPNNGILNTNWNAPKISAFLRSLDYGVYPIFPKPKIYTNAWYQIESYQFIKLGVRNFVENTKDELYFDDEKFSVKIKLKTLAN